VRAQLRDDLIDLGVVTCVDDDTILDLDRDPAPQLGPPTCAHATIGSDPCQGGEARERYVTLFRHPEENCNAPANLPGACDTSCHVDLDGDRRVVVALRHQVRGTTM
jgi:hypothetical protein